MFGSAIAVAVCGIGAANGSASAIAFGALALAGWRLDAHVAFTQRHGAVLGTVPAFASIATASLLGALVRAGAAFALGRALGGLTP